MKAIAFCNVATIPVRSMESHRSEMTTQLLFGETYEVIRWNNNWAQIRTLYDNYEGYIDAHQIAWIHESTYEKMYVNNCPKVANSTIILHDDTRDCNFTISMGSSLPLYDEQHIQLGIEKFTLQSPIENVNTDKKSILALGNKLLNTPYLWGGRSIMGIDCSGLVQVIHKIVGITLPRDASQQCSMGISIPWEEAICGDIAFFDNEKGNIVHVGMVQDKHTILHCSGKVRIDKLDSQGIFCLEREEYSHRLKCIKRI